MPLKDPTPWQGWIEGTGTFKWRYGVGRDDDDCFDVDTAKRIAIEFVEANDNYCGNVVVTDAHSDNEPPEEDHRDA